MTSAALSQDELRAFARDTVERVWNGNDWSPGPEIYAQDIIVHLPFKKEPLRGLEAFRQFHVDLHTAFPDWHATVETAIADGEHVAMRWTITGTSRAPFMGLPATGASFKTYEALFARMAPDGKVAEFWFFVNEAELARQLGLMPSGPPPKALILALRLRQRLRRGK